MATILQRGEIDLGHYLADGPTITKVRPASAFREQLHAKFRGEVEKQWGSLPFRKTLDQVRLRPGDMSIWTGINGDGKSAILGQVMLGLMGSAARVCIASLEMTPAQTLARMAMQASAKVMPSTEYLDAFSSWTDEKLWLYDHLGSVRWKDMVALARYLHAEIGIQHFVLDSFTKCGIAPDNYEVQKQFVDELHSHCKATEKATPGRGMHVHLVCHMRKNERAGYQKRPSKFDVRGAGEITDLPDNTFLVVRNRAKEEEREKPDSKLAREPDTFLIVEKQRDHSFEGSIGLWFHPHIRRWVETGLEDVQPMTLGIERVQQELTGEEF